MSSTLLIKSGNSPSSLTSPKTRLILNSPNRASLNSYNSIERSGSNSITQSPVSGLKAAFGAGTTKKNGFGVPLGLTEIAKLSPRVDRPSSKGSKANIFSFKSSLRRVQADGPKEIDDYTGEVLPPIDSHYPRNRNELMKGFGLISLAGDKPTKHITFLPTLSNLSEPYKSPSGPLKGFVPPKPDEVKTFGRRMLAQDSFLAKQKQYIYSETKKCLPGFTEEEIFKSEIPSPAQSTKASNARRQRTRRDETTPVRVFSNSVSIKETLNTQESDVQGGSSQMPSPDTCEYYDIKPSKRMRNLSVGLNRLSINGRVQTATGGHRDKSPSQLSPVTITFKKSGEGKSAGLKAQPEKKLKIKKVRAKNASVSGAITLQKVINEPEKKRNIEDKLKEQKNLMDQWSPIHSPKTKLSVFTKTPKGEVRQRAANEPATPLFIESLAESPLLITSLHKKKLSAAVSPLLKGGDSPSPTAKYGTVKDGKEDPELGNLVQMIGNSSAKRRFVLHFFDQDGDKSFVVDEEEKKMTKVAESAGLPLELMIERDMRD